MVAHLCFDPSVTLVVDAQPPALDYLLWNKVELFARNFLNVKVIARFSWATDLYEFGPEYISDLSLGHR